jgi:hypothetical protein
MYKLFHVATDRIAGISFLQAHGLPPANIPLHTCCGQSNSLTAASTATHKKIRKYEQIPCHHSTRHSRCHQEGYAQRLPGASGNQAGRCYCRGRSCCQCLHARKGFQQ